MPIDCSDLDQLAEDSRCWSSKFDQQQLQAVIAYLTCQATNSSATQVSAYTEQTSTYQIAAATDYCINCTSGTFTVTLPTAVGITGQQFVIKNSGAGTITIATTSSQTIDGDATVNLNQYDALTVFSDGANWIIV